MPRYYDDDDFPRPRRRRRRQSTAAPWIVGGGVLGITLLVAVVAIGVARSSRGGRENPKNPGDAIEAARNRLADPADGVVPFSTTFPPPHWTHQNLADFLQTKGVGVSIRPDPALRSSNGEGVWFEDTRDLKRGGRKGRIRVYRCPTPRDAARQVAVMRPEVWIPYAAGNFAIGHDSKDDPTDEDLDFGTRLKGAFF